MTMTIYERLLKYGHIKNFKRKDDPRRFDIYLENGLVRIECKRGVSGVLTIDSFIYFFVENLPCEYSQFMVQHI